MECQFWQYYGLLYYFQPLNNPCAATKAMYSNHRVCWLAHLRSGCVGAADVDLPQRNPCTKPARDNMKAPQFLLFKKVLLIFIWPRINNRVQSPLLTCGAMMSACDSVEAELAKALSRKSETVSLTEREMSEACYKAGICAGIQQPPRPAGRFLLPGRSTSPDLTGRSSDREPGVPAVNS